MQSRKGEAGAGARRRGHAGAETTRIAVGGDGVRRRVTALAAIAGGRSPRRRAAVRLRWRPRKCSRRSRRAPPRGPGAARPRRQLRDVTYAGPATRWRRRLQRRATTAKAARRVARVERAPRDARRRPRSGVPARALPAARAGGGDGAASPARSPLSPPSSRRRGGAPPRASFAGRAARARRRRAASTPRARFARSHAAAPSASRWRARPRGRHPRARRVTQAPRRAWPCRRPLGRHAPRPLRASVGGGRRPLRDFARGRRRRGAEVGRALRASRKAARRCACARRRRGDSGHVQPRTAQVSDACSSPVRLDQRRRVRAISTGPVVARPRDCASTRSACAKRGSACFLTSIDGATR